jgi:hypothetical protein
MSQHPPQVTVNGRDYRWPAAPTVVIFLDGSDPATSRRRSTKASRPISPG